MQKEGSQDRRKPGVTAAQSLPECDEDALRHSERFRQVANRYPHRVAQAYGGTKRAMRETDEQVAATVAEWEREQGLEPRDWPAIGAAERNET